MSLEYFTGSKITQTATTETILDKYKKTYGKNSEEYQCLFESYQKCYSQHKELCDSIHSSTNKQCEEIQKELPINPIKKVRTDLLEKDFKEIPAENLARYLEKLSGNLSWSSLFTNDDIDDNFHISWKNLNKVNAMYLYLESAGIPQEKINTIKYNFSKMDINFEEIQQIAQSFENIDDFLNINFSESKNITIISNMFELYKDEIQNHFEILLGEQELSKEEKQRFHDLLSNFTFSNLRDIYVLLGETKGNKQSLEKKFLIQQQFIVIEKGKLQNELDGIESILEMNLSEEKRGLYIGKKNSNVKRLDELKLQENSLKLALHTNDVFTEDDIQKIATQDSNFYDQKMNDLYNNDSFFQELSEICEKDENIFAEKYEEKPYTTEYQSRKTHTSRSNIPENHIMHQQVQYDFTQELNGNVTIDTGNKKIEITQDELKIVENNQEALDNLINFKNTLDELHISNLWDLRDDIFTVLRNEYPIYFNENDTFLSEHEVVIFLNSLLASVDLKLYNSPHINTLKSNFWITNNISALGGTNSENQINGNTSLEQTFLNKFCPIMNNGTFEAAKFREAIS